MQWTEIGESNELLVWTIPAERVKNRKTQIVPLTPQMRRLIEQQRKTGPYVFGGKTPMPESSWASVKKTKAWSMEAADWVWHDLRRTVATHLQELGVPYETFSAVLNHSKGTSFGISAVYARYSYIQEKYQALYLWNRWLQNHVITSFKQVHEPNYRWTDLNDPDLVAEMAKAADATWREPLPDELIEQSWDYQAMKPDAHN